MEMFHVLSVYDAINKRKIKFLYIVMLSKNALCVMCREYAENELQRQWITVIILILFS